MREEFKIKVIAKARQSLVKKLKHCESAFLNKSEKTSMDNVGQDAKLVRQEYSATNRGVCFLVKTRAPREKEKANKEVIDLISKYFKINKSSIIIKKGMRSNIKTIVIAES